MLSRPCKCANLPEVGRDVGAAIHRFICDQVLSQITSSIGVAALGAAFAALTLPMTLVQATDLIDSSWEVASNRADKVAAINRVDKAAIILAEFLAARGMGGRPVTLVGFELGAQLVLKCLVHLSTLGEAGRGQISL
ncbi:hypothetical protein T484DRAFT_1856108 [Baffinella frigidus]|nr:hypothetical protein T484DRAFT_1856108 [Cryptophyta sp. CCMP2293]